MRELDHEGLQVPPNEPDDATIMVWKITPHPGTGRDYMVCRSWHDMLDYFFNKLDVLLEREDVDEAVRSPEGFNINFRLVEMIKSDWRDIQRGED